MVQKIKTKIRKFVNKHKFITFIIISFITLSIINTYLIYQFIKILN